MSLMTFHRVDRLPDQFEPDSVYLLKGEHDHDMEMHVVGTDPNDPVRAMTAKDVMAMMLQKLSELTQIIIVVPTWNSEMVTYISPYIPRATADMERALYMTTGMGSRRTRLGGGMIMPDIPLPEIRTMRDAQW